MKITILIPMYNEQEILPDTLARLSAFAKESFREDYELLFVDDGSTDGSASLVEAFPDPAIRLISYTPNRGKGYAVRTGMLAARGERILFTDCDLAYGTAAIRQMLDYWQVCQGADAVVASRVLHPMGYEGYTPLRRLLSQAYRSLLRLFFGLQLSDSQSGLKAFSAHAAREIFSRCEIDRFAFDFEAIMIGTHLGFSFAEMPACVVGNRQSSRVRPLRDGLRMLRDLNLGSLFVPL